MVNDQPQTHIVENQSEIIPNYPSRFTYVQGHKTLQKSRIMSKKS
jgi:hypothetical protein